MKRIMKKAISSENPYPASRLFPFMTAVFLGIFLLTVFFRTTALGEETPPSGKAIGADAVWHPGSLVIRQIGQVCPQGGGCFIDEMRKAGASAPAVQFTERLIAHGFPFCFMRSFEALGRVDMVKVDCPFMANTMGFTLLVNGSPLIVSLGDKKILADIDLRQAPQYASIIQKYAKAEIWPDGAFVAMKKRADGGQRFIWKHKLLNGCRACEFAGTAIVAYDFDCTGHFRGVKLLALRKN